MVHLPVKMSSKIDSTICVPEVIWRYLQALEMPSDKGNIIFEMRCYIIIHIECIAHFVGSFSITIGKNDNKNNQTSQFMLLTFGTCIMVKTYDAKYLTSIVLCVFWVNGILSQSHSFVINDEFS
jgi:hypothetical protein